VIVTPAGEPVAEPWTCAPVDAVAETLLASAGSPARRPAVVAVDGRSGSGKSTFAELLHRAIADSVVVHTDDVAWWESFFGWDDLLASGLLEPARAGAAVRFRPPAWDARGREGSIDVPAGTAVVILEGVGACRRSLTHLVDARAWVQSDYAEARRRGLARDGGDHAATEFWDEWTAEEEPFLLADRPWERADVVVCGTHHLSGVTPARGEVVVGRRSAS
jgi:energy-coupling factor transporter ATP-binding protein EcfA2